MAGAILGTLTPSQIAIIVNDVEAAKRSYGYRTRGKGLASACVNCGQCLSVCPQHIESAGHMARAAELFE